MIKRSLVSYHSSNLRIWSVYTRLSDRDGDDRPLWNPFDGLGPLYYLDSTVKNRTSLENEFEVVSVIFIIPTLQVQKIVSLFIFTFFYVENEVLYQLCSTKHIYFRIDGQNKYFHDIFNYR